VKAVVVAGGERAGARLASVGERLIILYIALHFRVPGFHISTARLSTFGDGAGLALKAIGGNRSWD
jgi:hypothetical protein